MLMTPKTHIGNTIIQTLEERNLTIAWLARQVACDESNFYKKLKNDTINKELLFWISHILRKNFFNYYSDELHSLW